MPEIRMLQEVSGARPDGQEWPARGYTLDVGEDEYGELIAAGLGAPLAEGRGKRTSGKHGRRAADQPDRSDDEKADAAQDSRDAAADLHAKAAETRRAAKDAREYADSLDEKAGEAEAAAADAQDEADEFSKAEDDRMSDEDKARRSSGREAHPVFTSDDGGNSLGNPGVAGKQRGAKGRTGQGDAGQLP